MVRTGADPTKNLREIMVNRSSSLLGSHKQAKSLGLVGGMDGRNLRIQS
jgi:hypothetical protein